MRPVWAEINLDDLKHNIGEVKKMVNQETKICAVIKADAYGHGAVRIAQTLLDNGAHCFAVATLSEALELRRVFKDVPILILGYTPVEEGDALLTQHITQTLYTLDQAIAFNQLGEKLNHVLKVHIKIDTGMHRLGFPVSEASLDAIKAIHALPFIEIEGIFSHFAMADEKDKSFSHSQAKHFMTFTESLEAQGVTFAIKHMCNSAGIIDLPEYHMDMVRAGIMLYGLYPSDEVHKERVNLKEVMTLKAEVSHVKTLEAGEGLSYGLTYTTQDKETIVTVPIGYADGFTRLYSGKAKAFYEGRVLDQVGRICMDQCLFKSDHPSIQMGTTLALMGGNLHPSIAIDAYAKNIGTINYEIVCMIGKRVPRRYIQDGIMVDYHDAILNG